VVYDGPASALTPDLLRELYGVQADEILADAQRPATSPVLVPSAPWGSPVAQTA
jgi:phosphonate transport system ATP-binding protein